MALKSFTARLSVASAILAIALPVLTADAGFRKLRSNYEPGETIIAQSRFGNGSVTGVVRPARYGWQVRLPGGTWMDCRRSCEETLRVETVDLFENSQDVKGYGGLNNECGVFGCLSIGF